MKELMKTVAAILALWIICGSTTAFAERRADGEIIPLKISSNTYPGTSRTLSVWVPDAYDGTTPSCLIIRMDSMGKTPEAVSELMSEGAMPVTIAVNIDPGKIYKPGSDEVIRYNRSNEFDRTDGRFADFLEYEVIPALEGILTSDGRRLRISDRASDRALMGYSSGGIAAFNAAWERPDLFSRVYTGLSLPSGPVEAIALDGNRLYALSGGKIWVRTINRSGFKDPKLVPEPQREGQG